MDTYLEFHNNQLMIEKNFGASFHPKYIGKKTQRQYATPRILHSQSGLLAEKQT